MQTQSPSTVLAGRYALEEELGRSGTGMVWRAQDRLLNRTVSVKLIHPSLGDDRAFAERLAEEVRRVASLSAPGIARLLDSGAEQGVPFLVREHVEGESARGRLEGSGVLPAAEAVRIATAVLEALAVAHEAGVLHLGLDLDDVLLASDGGVRVTDLGIGPAVTATRPAEESARLLGGEGLAPEQAGAGAAGARTDVFAVGAVLFELLTGEAPRGRRSPRERRSSLPRGLDRAVARALSPDPLDRFDTARAFASAIAPGALTDEAVDGQPHRGWMRTWLGVPVAITVVAAAAIPIGLWFGRLEVGGPLGIRAAHEEPSTAPAPTTQTLRPEAVEVLDPPPGDGSENDSTARLAVDGDQATAWRSENYFDGRLNKPGVGLVFDLGERRRVVGFRLWTPHPGFEFHVAIGDDPDALIAAIGVPYVAAAETRGVLDASGRYLLVWITTVVTVEDGSRAEVSELRVVVAGDA